MTLKNQHLHGVIRHRLGHVPICDSICIQMEFVHGFQHCYFLKYIRTKRANDCYQVQLFSGVKCKHQLTRDLSAWLNERLMYHTLSAAMLENGKLNYKHKAKAHYEHTLDWDNSCTYECITFKNIAKIDL